tara:strand:- start:5 stop:220 length:216 start_codon:yes stop_codon:yes gene_type:complete
MVKTRKHTVVVPETYSTATLLALPIQELKRHLNASNEALCELDDLLHTEQTYNHRVKRVMDVKSMIDLEEK